MKKLFILFALVIAASFTAAAQNTSTKTVTVTASGSTQPIADNKSDRLAEDYILANIAGLDAPLAIENGACVANANDIYLREDATAVAPLVPCAVKLNGQGKTRLIANRVDIVFARLVRQHIQRTVKDRRAIVAANNARETEVGAADEIDPND
jgi:predicted metal-dependent phosphoesterase TrpH